MHHCIKIVPLNGFQAHSSLGVQLFHERLTLPPGYHDGRMRSKMTKFGSFGIGTLLSGHLPASSMSPQISGANILADGSQQRQHQTSTDTTWQTRRKVQATSIFLLHASGSQPAQGCLSRQVSASSSLAGKGQIKSGSMGLLVDKAFP